MGDRVVVLLAEADSALRDYWTKALLGVADVRPAATVEEARAQIDEASILVTGWFQDDKRNGDSLISAWVRQRLGHPLVVIHSPGEIPREEMDTLYLRGVSAFVELPCEPGTIVTIVSRLVAIQSLQQKYDAQVALNEKLKQAIIGVAIFALIGNFLSIDQLPALVNFLIGLI